MSLNTNYPYVSFEISKELKQIGFDECCSAVYEINTSYDPPKIEFIKSGVNNQGWNLEHFKKSVEWMEKTNRPSFFNRDTKNSLLSEFLIAAPTYSEVIDWLYEKHELFISFNITTNEGLGFTISQQTKQPVTRWVQKVNINFLKNKEEMYFEAVFKSIKLLNKS